MLRRRDRSVCSAQGSALGLDQGRVELEGTVYLNGQTLEAYIQKIVAEMLG